MATSGRMTMERASAIVRAVRRAELERGAHPRHRAAAELGYDRSAFSRAYLRAQEMLGHAPTPKPGPDPFKTPKTDAMGVTKAAEVMRDAIADDAAMTEIRNGIRQPQGYAISAENVWIIDKLRSEGMSIVERGAGRFFLDRQPAPGYLAGSALTLYSDKDHKFRFGAMGDTHIGSQYHRKDVLDALYRRYEAAGITDVFHTGNYIEGESRFNKHELLAHSMQGQVAMLTRDYPHVAGITTHAISGDDHEGWYAQREGINIGRFTQDAFRHAGRFDWHDLGYMEAHVRLVNSDTGKESMMSVVHPGGGSSYAVSYSIQKIIESLDGGEKPAVGLYGHYHKLMAMNIRNVWALQTGCCQDQSGFMRKKKLEAHVGGALVTLEQDPRTGAIIGFLPEMWRYFVKSYTNDRWRHGEDVNHAERMAA